MAASKARNPLALMDAAHSMPPDRSAPETSAAAHDFTLLWGAPPAQWELAPQAVHIWSALLDQPEPFTATLAATLSPDERARSERFRFDQERRRYSTGRGLLRQILGRYTNSDPGRLVFDYGPEGKPSLPPGAGMAFNLSHTGRLIVVAVTRQESVGIDVERVCRIAEMERIAETYFSKHERKRFKECEPMQRQRLFFGLWTLKEARLKRDGRGLPEMDKLDETPDGYARAFAPSPGCIGCLSLAEKPAATHFWHWPTA